MSIKLYAWQPISHGDYSIFVLAENESQARKSAEKFITENKIYYQFNDWEDGYKLTVAEIGEVIVNANA